MSCHLKKKAYANYRLYTAFSSSICVTFKGHSRVLRNEASNHWTKSIRNVRSINSLPHFPRNSVRIIHPFPPNPRRRSTFLVISTAHTTGLQPPTRTTLRVRREKKKLKTADRPSFSRMCTVVKPITKRRRRRGNWLSSSPIIHVVWEGGARWGEGRPWINWRHSLYPAHFAHATTSLLFPFQFFTHCLNGMRRKRGRGF